MIINNNLEAIQNQVAKAVDAAIEKVENASQIQYEDINLMRETKLLSMKRELNRLIAKLGESHPRVLDLQLRLKKYSISRTMVSQAVLRNKLQAPTINKRVWTVNGVVTNDDGTPQANKLIAFTDADKKLVTDIGTVKTDETGYYEINVPLTDEDFAEMEKVAKVKVANAIREAAGLDVSEVPEASWVLKDKVLHLTVMDEDKKIIERIEQPLIFKPGLINTQTIAAGLKKNAALGNISSNVTKSVGTVGTQTAVSDANRATTRETVKATIENIRNKVTSKTGAATAKATVNNTVAKNTEAKTDTSGTVTTSAKKTATTRSSTKKDSKKTDKKTGTTTRRVVNSAVKKATGTTGKNKKKKTE